jgi:HEAT repeat protein
VRWLFVAFAAIGLAGCGSPATMARGKPVSHWVAQLQSTDSRQRKTAVEVLGNVGTKDPAALTALIDALRDADPRIRDAAILALMKSGPAAARAAPALEAAAADSDQLVREHAAIALRRINHQD